uniref:Tripartite motif containing 15 n=1 Tax=Suricata suricatta TaxID=37032 RepID=A0A673T4B1_SURSU
MDPVSVPVPLGTLEEMQCEEHGEKVLFFCGRDAELLCARCREGPSHQAHSVRLLDGAAQPSRVRSLRSQLEALRVEREETEDMKRQEDPKFQMLLVKTRSSWWKLFEKLQQELGEQRRLLLARLSELEVQLCQEREEYASRFSEEVARLGAAAQELASVLLHSKICVCEKTFVSPETISPALVKKIQEVHRKILPLPEMLRTFSESLVHHLETDSGAGTGDPPAVSGSTALSEDRKPMRFTRNQQDLPRCPRSSEGVPAPGVLGSKGFTWGKVYWEVEVDREGCCLVGVARDSVKRKGDVSLRPEDGVWALRLSSAGIWANTDPEAELFPALRPRRVGIALDYEGGTVTFTNAESQELIYTFTATFTRRLVPFLWLKWPGTRLMLRP